MKPEIAVLLLNMGGPDKPEAIGPFLCNLFSDPDIISFPGGKRFQKLFAWCISSLRKKKVADIYNHIGGSSPILPLTANQANALAVALKQDGYTVKVYTGMRYWFPFIEDAVKQIFMDGIRHIVALPLYPQYSLTTTGSSINQLQLVLSEYQDKIKLDIVPHYYNNALYLEALASTIQQALAKNPWSCTQDKVTILFSAHSLPEKYVKKTGDPYPEHIKETIKSVMTGYFPDRSWYLSYQSKVGPIAWLKPSTDNMIKELAVNNNRNILVVPVSFVSDHLETLYEIDIMYKSLATRHGIEHFYRAETMNTHPVFIKSLAELVKTEIEKLNREVSLAV